LHHLATDFPESFTFIQYHFDDWYALPAQGNEPWAVHRDDFYLFEQFPSTWFDGVLECRGCYYDDDQQYNWYLHTYNLRRALPTDIWIQVGGESLGGQTYCITARVGMDPAGAARPVRVYLAHVLDNFPASSDHRYRNCLRPPTVPTVDITLQPNTHQEISHDFTFDGTSWAHQTDIKIVVWVQAPEDYAPADVSNAYELRWPFAPLPPLYDTGDLNCDGAINAFDIDPFVLALTDPAAYAATYPNCNILNADIDCDGAVGPFDIDPFVTCLTVGCPACP
jgi:hypothetical protein